jgi:3-hydroxybutyryl-CoA dehydratase
VQVLAGQRGVSRWVEGKEGANARLAAARRANDQEQDAMSEFYVKPGDSVTFAKTVGETDIYLFAGITGDFAVNHVNEQYMARSKYGKRIAHGALLIGFASTCSSMMIEKCHGTAGDETAVSLGYDKVRFLGPVYIGDTVTLTYTITEVDPAKRRSRSEIKVVNQRGELVGVAQHILAWVKDKA